MSYHSISPSVYVIYRSLCANANIGLIDLSPDPGLAPSGGLAPFGPVYTTTIGYPPEALSNSHCFSDGWVAMNYTDIQHPPPYHECGETSPYFSFPVDLTTLDPAWGACKINAYGGFDPPRALNKAVALISIPATPTSPGLDEMVTTSIAVPGSRIGLAYASATAPSAAGSSTSKKVPGRHKTSFDRVSAHKEDEDDPNKDEVIEAVTHLAASFANIHASEPAQMPDQGFSDSSNRVVVCDSTCIPPTPLLSSQTRKFASEVQSANSDSNSPEGASIVVDGNDHPPASLLPAFKQNSGQFGRASNFSDVEAFMGGCSGKINGVNQLCVAIMICVGFRAFAFVW